MLTKMRKPVAKAITFVLFGLLILSFAVWGIGDIFRGPGQATTVASVGSVEIDAQDFSRTLRQEINRLQSSFGRALTLEEARDLGLVDQVLGQMVNRALFDDKAVALRMLVSENQLKQQIADEQAFKNAVGDFDQVRYQQTLFNLGLSEAGYLAMLNQDVNREQIVDALGGVEAAPEALTRRLYRYAGELRQAETILIRADTFTELASPSDEDLATLHEEASTSFMSPETREVSLVYLRAADLTGEVAISEEDLQAIFEERREALGSPERRQVEQMILDSAETAQAAKQRIEEGESFADVAQDLTGFGPTALGALSRADLNQQLPALADSVFAASAGGLSEPVESDFGWHLALISEIQEGVEAVFEEERDNLREELALDQAVDALVSLANALDDELGSGALLEEAAGSLGVSVTKIPAVDARGNDAEGNPVPGLPPLDEFQRALTETPVGQESLLLETRDGDYFVLRVESVTPAELRPLAEVRDDVVLLWEGRERLRLAEERAEALAARAGEGVELSRIAEEEGLELTTQGPVDRFGQPAATALPGEPPVERRLVGPLFEAKQGDVFTAGGDQGYLVAKLTEVERPDPSAAPDDLTQLEENVANSMNSDILTGFTAALRSDSPVAVNQALIENLIMGAGGGHY